VSLIGFAFDEDDNEYLDCGPILEAIGELGDDCNDLWTSNQNGIIPIAWGDAEYTLQIRGYKNIPDLLSIRDLTEKQDEKQDPYDDAELCLDDRWNFPKEPEEKGKAGKSWLQS